MTNYHPATNIILEDIKMVRERVLPSHVYGRVTVNIDDEVTGTKVVATGRMPEEYIIIDIAEAMGIDRSKTDKINAAIAVDVGDPVGPGTPLATARRRRDRRNIPTAPAEGIVSLIENGRIVLQVNRSQVELFARVPGTVVGIIGDRGVRIESTGTLIQCAWGNGKFGFGTYYLEPETGLLSLTEQDNILATVRGNIYVLQRPITGDDLHVVAQQDLGGLVGPSMPFYLQDAARMLKVPVLLTEGFGNHKMSRVTAELLRKYARQRDGAFDGSMPSRWEFGKPEIVLSGAVSRPVEPAIGKVLSVSDVVRIRSGAFMGEIGEIAYLPPKQVRLETGLRVPVAQIKLRSRPEKLLIPLANLEIMGNSKQ